MREIKFRAWDKTENKWLFGYDYKNLGGFNLIGEVVLMGQLNQIPLAKWSDIDIMQYTGIKTYEGVEIYEGDINVNGEPVVFEKGSFWFKCKNGVRSINQYSKIISNIHQNPELLSNT